MMEIQPRKQPRKSNAAMTSENTANSKSPKPTVVKTRVSGVVLSLPSEGRKNLRGVVMLSEGLERALWAWADQPIPAGLKSENQAAVVDRLADEVVAEFGIPRDRAVFFADVRATYPQDKFGPTA
jgi:hypothetical protein